jgi:hypothetical protein
MSCENTINLTYDPANDRVVCPKTGEGAYSFQLLGCSPEQREECRNRPASAATRASGHQVIFTETTVFSLINRNSPPYAGQKRKIA